MKDVCFCLSQENYNDIDETILRMKLRDKTIRTVRGINSKLYKICFGSSYFKYIILAISFLYGNIIQKKRKINHYSFK